MVLAFQTWGQILSKVFKCKYFSFFQMQILLFSSNTNTFQSSSNTFSNTFKYFKFYMLIYMNILNVKSITHIKWRLKIVKNTR